MAALRALGSIVENSGIDDAWIEADVYGSNTVKEILNCSHYKRSVTAHTYMYCTMYEVLIEYFFSDNDDLKPVLRDEALQVNEACSLQTTDAANEAYTVFNQALASIEFVFKFDEWVKTKKQQDMGQIIAELSSVG